VLGGHLSDVMLLKWIVERKCFACNALQMHKAYSSSLGRVVIEAFNCWSGHVCEIKILFDTYVSDLYIQFNRFNCAWNEMTETPTDELVRGLSKFCSRFIDESNASEATFGLTSDLRVSGEQVVKLHEIRVT
jgi:hypothetical protein